MKKGYLRLETDDLTQSYKEEQPKFFESLKTTLFVTYFQILETKQLSENMGILLTAFSYIQLISMSFNDNNQDL
jgi:hypothetical protein